MCGAPQKEKLTLSGFRLDRLPHFPAGGGAASLRLDADTCEEKPMSSSVC